MKNLICVLAVVALVFGLSGVADAKCLSCSGVKVRVLPRVGSRHRVKHACSVYVPAACTPVAPCNPVPPACAPAINAPIPAMPVPVIAVAPKACDPVASVAKHVKHRVRLFHRYQG